MRDGQFTGGLRFYNIIDFRFPNATERTASLREENIWFAPEARDAGWCARVVVFREDTGYE